MKNQKKFIFITGGVSSSLGKGLAAACIGHLIESRGIKINMLKMDPYINVDPGTMSPFQHGEVFVTDDGAETDLDLGHYERFTTLSLSRKNNFTTGQVYLNVIENERQGKYLGKTVQVVPHVTDEIKRRIRLAAEDADILIGEIGGTVGDIESLPFIEAIRQVAYDVGPENVLFVHLVLVPYLKTAGELKTKPAQHSVKELRSVGLFPNIILCRSDREIDNDVIEKISLFCDVPKRNVFQSVDSSSIYKVPLALHNQGLDERIIELLGIWTASPNIMGLKKLVHNIDHPKDQVHIGIIGKYTDLEESYKSLNEALVHAAIEQQLELKLHFISSEKLEKKSSYEELSKVQGILVPGGFGERGSEGKMAAIRYARENGVPFFGICLGLQLAIIEFARNVAQLPNATSDEFEQDLNGDYDSVIHFMKGQGHEIQKGGSMRLGAYDCEIVKGTKTHKIYGQSHILERHRHRLEVNNNYVKQLEDKGLVFSGRNKDLNLVEIIEITSHPHFVACQFHPEFKSTPFDPHPLFRSFIFASSSNKSNKK